MSHSAHEVPGLALSRELTNRVGGEVTSPIAVPVLRLIRNLALSPFLVNERFRGVLRRGDYFRFEILLILQRVVLGLLELRVASVQVPGVILSGLHAHLVLERAGPEDEFRLGDLAVEGRVVGVLAEEELERRRKVVPGGLEEGHVLIVEFNEPVGLLLDP